MADAHSCDRRRHHFGGVAGGPHSDAEEVLAMKLAIADPPYPPLFSERHDLKGGDPRTTWRSRATRWYGHGTRSLSDSPPADYHPDAARWDDLDEHRKLLLHLVGNYDGWAIATTPDGLGAYYPLPVSAHIMVWHRPTALPGGNHILHHWEAVIVSTPRGRRNRTDGDRISDVLTANAPSIGFIGAKPAVWTEWVLKALGYLDGDSIHDLFPGSGSVSAVWT